MVLELAHWRHAGGDGFGDAAAVAAQGMKKFCTKALIQQDNWMAVMTIVYHPECFQCPIRVDPTSTGNPPLVPIRKQMNLKEVAQKINKFN